MDSSDVGGAVVQAVAPPPSLPSHGKARLKGLLWRTDASKPGTHIFSVTFYLLLLDVILCK